MSTISVGSLDLDLDVFQGPFDLLITLVLREEVDLREVEVADIVLAYVGELERAGEFDIEATTYFLVLIASLLELKTRMMLPDDGEEPGAPEPMEAAEELFERLVEYQRFRGASEWLRERGCENERFHYRRAPLPARLRRARDDQAGPVYDARRLGRAVGGLLRRPPPLDLSHLGRTRASVGEQVAHLRELLRRRRSVDFAESVRRGDSIHEAVALWALLELYRAGEADWTQERNFGPITISAVRGAAAAKEKEDLHA